MALFNLFGEQEHRVFNYTPIYYDKEKEELKQMFDKIGELYEASMRSLDLQKDYDINTAQRLEDEIDGYKKRLLDGHMIRLNEGKCKPESSGVFINLVNNLERAGDHLMFIANAFYEANEKYNH